ncbi:hypothetical protein E4T39_04531 [Aureobasidium subglaciale]|nr:hypothetical protein E4T39_04531 [Aureobasidium subglaciale]
MLTHLLVCDVEYQQSDSAFHATVCGPLEMAGKRPSSSHHRIIAFPPSNSAPSFLWVDGGDGSLSPGQDSRVCVCNAEYNKDDFKFWLLDESTAPISIMWYEQPGQEKTESYQTIYKTSGERYYPLHANGPLFANAYEIRDGVRVHVDFDMQRVRMHIDFLKALVDKGGNVTARGFPAKDMVDAVLVLCQGEYMHTRYPFMAVRIHKNHAVFAEGATSPIFRSLIKQYFISMNLQTPDLGDDHLTNYPATMLHLSLNPEQVEIADDRWLGKVGNVLIVSQECEGWPTIFLLDVVCS